GSLPFAGRPPALQQGKDWIAMLFRRTLALAVAGLTVLGLAASTGRAAEPDAKLMPGDAEFVLVANYRQIIGSAMFKKYGMEPFKAQLQDPQVKPVLDALGLNPLEDIDTL